MKFSSYDSHLLDIGIGISRENYLVVIEGMNMRLSIEIHRQDLAIWIKAVIVYF